MRISLAHCAVAALVASGPAHAQTERGPIPSNGADFCFQAPSIAGFGLFPFNNASANEDGMDHTLCAKDRLPGVIRDLWWRWTSPVSGPVTISTCGLTAVDTEIAVYAPFAVCAPGDEALIACDDQNCGNQTEITFLAVAGQTYLFRIGSYDGGAPGGPGQFRISGAAPEHGAAYCQEFEPSFGFGVSSGAIARVADDFTSPADTLVNMVSFTGDYGSGSATPGADAFTIAYLADNDGVPGATIALFAESNGLTIESPALTGEFVKGLYRQFSYLAHHPPVPIRSGERIWIEVRNFGSTWFWTASAQGNGFGYRDGLADGYSPDDAIAVDMTLCVGPVKSCLADVDGDGDTDFADLNQVIANFNTACP